MPMLSPVTVIQTQYEVKMMQESTLVKVIDPTTQVKACEARGAHVEVTHVVVEHVLRHRGITVKYSEGW